MTKALVIGVGTLVTKFFAHTFCVFGSLSAAGAVTACLLQPLFYRTHDFRGRVHASEQVAGAEHRRSVSIPHTGKDSPALSGDMQGN